MPSFIVFDSPEQELAFYKESLAKVKARLMIAPNSMACIRLMFAYQRAIRQREKGQCVDDHVLSSPLYGIGSEFHDSL